MLGFCAIGDIRLILHHYRTEVKKQNCYCWMQANNYDKNIIEWVFSRLDRCEDLNLLYPEPTYYTLVQRFQIASFTTTCHFSLWIWTVIHWKGNAFLRRMKFFIVTEHIYGFLSIEYHQCRLVGYTMFVSILLFTVMHANSVQSSSAPSMPFTLAGYVLHKLRP